jgi:hypothetical protein
MPRLILRALISLDASSFRVAPGRRNHQHQRALHQFADVRFVGAGLA